jgi:hypothetical protein
MSKNVLVPYRIINTVSAGSTVTSGATSIRFLDNIGVSVQWSSGTSPVGVYTVEASIDGLTWKTLADDAATTASVSGASGSYLLRFSNCAYDKLRVVYTFTSGTGTLNAYIMGKSIGS